jgi:hypothetical protein
VTRTQILSATLRKSPDSLGPNFIEIRMEMDSEKAHTY